MILPPITPSEHLHQWSAYRAQLTSALAEGILDPTRLEQGDKQMEEISECINWRERSQQFARSITTMVPPPPPPLIDARAQSYFRFGLPRVALPTNKGCKLTKLGDQFNQQGSVKFIQQQQRQHLHPQQQQPQQQQQGGGRATSEMDLNRATAMANGMPYASRGISIEHGLDQLHSVEHSPSAAHYAHSELMANGMPSRANGHLMGPTPTTGGPQQFLQSKRHHAHYFSNLDLFTHGDDGYNYLRYAKADEMRPVISKQPHLVLKNIAFEQDTRTTFDRHMLRAPNYVRTLDGITMEAFGGETIALMYTNEEEVKTLLELISNTNTRSGNPEGSFSLNGVPMGSKSLGERVAYVTNDDLYPHLTVKQHLQLSSSFQRPATQAFKADHMVSQLIQTLALGPFHDRMVSELGRTEKQRVKIACQILLDSDIIILDNIVQYMDLYDAAFVIDYLRDWATKLNRIVIMAIAPPTFEILAMFYKAAILASGRLVYFGRAQQMLSYFETLEYPCPLFKNPCDYYVDLVTRDHLTMDANLESSDRCQRLAEVWQQRQPIINDTLAGVAPPKIHTVDALTTMSQLIQRFYWLLFNQPCRRLAEVWHNLLLSVCLGILHFQATSKRQAGVNDRVNLFYALLTIFLLPNIWRNITLVNSDRELFRVDNKKHLYGATNFYISRLLFDLPVALLSYVAYCVPLYFLVDLQYFLDAQGLYLGVYIGTCVLYCYMWRMCAWLLACVCRRKHNAMLLAGILMALISIPSGFTLHPLHQWMIVHWLRLASPTQWAAQVLVSNEFFGNATRRLDQPYSPDTSQLYFKESIRTLRVLPGGGQDIPILLTNDVEISGAQAYAFANFTLPEFDGLDTNLLYGYGLGLVGIWTVTALLLNCVCVHCKHRPVKRYRHRD